MWRMPWFRLGCKTLYCSRMRMRVGWKKAGVARAGLKAWLGCVSGRAG